MMSESNGNVGGYACVPYLHNHESIEVKDTWMRSKNVEDVYFATATFSEDGKPYLSPSANNYLVAKFKDNAKMQKDVEKYKQEKASFVFNINDDLFERESNGNMNFLSIYYMDYGESHDDIVEVANVVATRDKVGKAGVGFMDLYCCQKPKFTFPYKDNIVVLEVSSDKSHQSVNKYCEQTRRHVCRKGINLTNLVSLSILEKLK